MAGIASLLSQFEGFGGDNAVTEPVIQRRSAVPGKATPKSPTRSVAEDVDSDDDDYEMPTALPVTSTRTDRSDSFSGFGNGGGVDDERAPEPPRRPSLAASSQSSGNGNAPEPPRRQSLIKGRAAASASASASTSTSSLASTAIYEEPTSSAAPAVPSSAPPPRASSSAGRRRASSGMMGNMFSKAKKGMSKGVKGMKKKMGRMGGGKKMRAASGTTHDDPSYPRVVSELGEVCAPVGYNLLEELTKMKETSLLKAAEKAATHCGGSFKDYVSKAEAFAAACIKSKSNGKLIKKEVAAIHLYTQKTPLHAGFNGALGGLGGQGRANIEPYLPFCKILMNALRKLKAVPTSAVYRGVKRPVSELLVGIGLGDAVEWWGCPSASLAPDLLRDDDFNKVKARTVFQIKVENAVNVHAFSDRAAGADDDFAVEDEVMLLPGSRFIVDAITKFENGITEVQMHEVSKGAGIYTDIESKYDTIDPESEDIYAPAGLYIAPGANSSTSADAYDSDDVDLDNAYDAIDEEAPPTVPARSEWRSQSNTNSNSNNNSIYTEPTAASTQDAGIYLGIGDDDIDVDVDLEEEKDQGGNDTYMSIAARGTAFGFGRKASLKKASVPAWKQKQAGNDIYMDVTESTQVTQGAAPTWKQRQRQKEASAASASTSNGNDIYMDVHDSAPSSSNKVVNEDAGSLQKRSSVFEFDSVPFGKHKSKSNSTTSTTAATNNASSADDVYMDIATPAKSAQSVNFAVPVAKGTSGDIMRRASSFLQSPGAILETGSSTNANPKAAAAAASKTRLSSEHFEGFGKPPAVVYSGVLDWKADILKKKAAKEQEAMANQVKEENKHAHLPQWKQDLIKRKQAKLTGVVAADVDA